MSRGPDDGADHWSRHVFTIEMRSEVDDSFSLTPGSVHLPLSYIGMLTGENPRGLGFEELGIALRETIEMMRPYGPSKELADSLIGRARALRDYADGETILSHILEAIAMYENLDDPRSLGRSYAVLGTTLRDGHLYYDALAALEKAYELLASIDDPAGVLVTYYDRAQICGKLDLYEEAIRLLYQAEDLLGAVPRPERLRMAILSSRAQFQEMAGANAAGLESAEALVRMVDDGKWAASDRSAASYIRAGMRRRSGDAAGALEDYVRAAEEGHRSMLGNATLRYRAGERRRLDPIFEFGLRTALETGEAEIAFGLLERSKAVGGTFASAAGMSESMRSDAWQQLRTDAAELREQARAAVRSADPEARRAAQDAAEWLVARRDLLLAQAHAERPEGPALRELAAWIQGSLPSDTLVLEYVTVADQVWGLTLSRESVTAVRIDLNLQDLALLLRSFGFECDGLLEVHALSRLGRSLLDPFGDQLHEARTVVVVPPTTLAELPIHAMPWLGAPLIDTHEVVYLPSASLLARPRPAPTRPAMSTRSRCTVFCVPAVSYQDVDELPGALDEATVVERLFETPEILLNAAATSERLLNLPPDVRVLHLACHAEFESDAPLLARLLLADRPVFSFEIMLLGLDVDVVNLNACHTAAARVHPSGEAEGLTSAFAAAGAGTQLASQWAVDDAAAYQFSTHFYQEILGSRHSSPRAAARSAQLALRRQRRTGHPYFWAPFTTVGGA